MSTDLGHSFPLNSTTREHPRHSSRHRPLLSHHNRSTGGIILTGNLSATASFMLQAYGLWSDNGYGIPETWSMYIDDCNNNSSPKPLSVLCMDSHRPPQREASQPLQHISLSCAANPRDRTTKAITPPALPPPVSYTHLTLPTTPYV